MAKSSSKKKKIQEYKQDEIEIEEDIFGSGGGYGKDKGGYKSIVLEQYRKCCEEGSKEMTTGGVIKRIIDGEIVEIMTLDQIEIFTNSVEMLKCLLIASIKKHEDVIGTRIVAVQGEIDKNESSRRKAYTKLNKWYRNKSDVINPEGVSESQSSHLAYVQMNKEIQKIYSKNKLRTHIKLLEVLGILLSHINYFDEIGGWV